MAGPAILLGAGASIDAGLPDTFKLTELIYDELKNSNYGKQAVLFGYVIAKLRARRVLLGGSPFERINVEEAYDTLLRILTKDQDILSEFASGWDPIFDFMRPEFDENAFMKGIIEAIQDQTRNRHSQIISIKQNALREAAKAISRSISGINLASSTTTIVSQYIDILVGILATPSKSTEYIDHITDFANRSRASVATLNYDVLFEDSCRRQSIELDYGLSSWNDRQITEWRAAATRLFKLHGSINWTGSPETITVLPSPPEVHRWQRSNALMIFGGENGKLTPDGPFLQLRNDFEKAILKTNKIMVIGYSFSDRHINSILRKWVSTKRGGKMVLLDPGDVDFGLDVFKKSYSIEPIRKTVELVHVKKTAATGISEAIRECESRCDLKYDAQKNGFLPHILVKRIT